MTTVKNSVVEKELVTILQEINEKFELGEEIDEDCVPGELVSSQILITVMGRISSSLKVIIPDNCYIFHDKHLGKLTIKEAAEKLIKVSKDGN